MEIGSHDPLRDAAKAGRLPNGWVERADGSRVPAQRDRETGWGDDRDAVNVARIEAARVAMADAVTTYQAASAKLFTREADMVADLVIAIRKADAMAEAWHAFVEATR